MATLSVITRDTLEGKHQTDRRISGGGLEGSKP